jgi:hypothetical protein
MSNPDDIVGTLLVGVALAALVILIVAFTAHFTAAMSRDPVSVRVDDRWVVTEGHQVTPLPPVVAVPRPRRPSHPQELSRDGAHLSREVRLERRPGIGTANVPRPRMDGGRN